MQPTSSSLLPSLGNVVISVPGQHVFYAPKLLQCSFELLNNFLRQYFWCGQVFSVFQGFILEPEDVEVGFVAGDEFVVSEEFPTFDFFWIRGVCFDLRA